MGLQMWTYYMPASLIDDAESFVRTAQGTDDYAMKMSCLRAAVLLAFASVDGRINELVRECFIRDSGYLKKYCKKGDDLGLKDIEKEITQKATLPKQMRYLFRLGNRIRYLKTAGIIESGMEKRLRKHDTNEVREYYNPMKHYFRREDQPE